MFSQPLITPNFSLYFNYSHGCTSSEYVTAKQLLRMQLFFVPDLFSSIQASESVLKVRYLHLPLQLRETWKPNQVWTYGMLYLCIIKKHGTGQLNWPFHFYRLSMWKLSTYCFTADNFIINISFSVYSVILEGQSSRNCSYPTRGASSFTWWLG